MRKLVALLLVLVLALGMVSTASAKKAKTLNIYWIGNQDDETIRTGVEEAINEYVEPLIGANVSIHIINWDDWTDQALKPLLDGEKIAALLEDKLLSKVSTVLRTTYFLPVLISMTVVALLFSFVYQPKIGLINAALKFFGIKNPPAWTGDPKTAIFSAIIMSQWHSTGYTTMLFIVAIQGISTDLYEAAEIDGAGRLQRFLHITVPQVREMMFVTMVTTVTGAFLVFNDVYILTQGGPGNASTTLAVYMYRNAFNLDKMGYASTIAVMMLIICLVLALIQNGAFRSGKGD